MKLVRMAPGHGDVLLAEGDPELASDEERLIAEFRRQLELGMWAAVPTATGARREALMVRDFAEVPRDAERVVFFPPASGGAAEARARELLRDSAGAGALETYEELGFLALEPEEGSYGYLLYPHRPIVIYDTEDSEPLGEWCVRFRDEGSALPPADDVLAKWLALQGDERELAARANPGPLGTQVDPGHVRRDLARLRAWRHR